MTDKPAEPINLFDCATTQKVIGQEKFLDAFKNILNHGAYCQGPETKELDSKLAEFAGTKYCSTCGSGTDALTLALMAWDVKPGDAVFVSSFTFVASAEAPVLLGATPIFVDSDPETYNMDIADLKRAIAEVKAEGKLNLKAIIPVDIFGSPCNYDEIMKIAKENGMKVLSDSCQSFGSNYKGKNAGSIADMTATSFYPTKPLGGYGDGGAVFTNNSDENDMVISCRVHGMSKEDHYDNIRLGMTGRMNSFQGAVLLLKLSVFKDELEKRYQVAKRYDNELSPYFGKQKILEGCRSAYALYTINCPDRDELITYLKANGIPCGAYYPRPVNTQTAYAKWNNRSLPVCEKLSKTVCSLPMTPYLSDEQMSYIIEKMNAFAATKMNKAA
ncbi:MAG: DegT/DnrJ/EryC1/StrS family aminotransferase [Alphaproteobacteria bacterium]|nr:DegT/DnrJ/EryC1/StrS family aminotransferase [Alphaproteobacteria bacterium]MBR3501733.1 DegT/DnrJ/EryC1/StrS family aminotransferase [Alphaproteobacteria bacterium]